MSRSGILAPLVLACASLAVGVGPVSAQCGQRFDWRLSPDLVDGAGSARLGIGAEIDSCFTGHDLTQSNPKSYYVEIDGRAVWVMDDVRIPQQSAITVRLGGSMSLRTLNRPDPNASPDAIFEPIDHDWGFLGVGVHGQYEASSDREEQALVGGLQLRWVRVGWWAAPSVVATFDVVKPTSSVSRDALTMEDEVYRRLTARGYWLAPAGAFDIEIDAGVFRSYGLDTALEALGWDSGGYLQGGVGWRAEWRISNRFTLERVSVAYAYGQLPTAPNDRKAWTIGLDFGR